MWKRAEILASLVTCGWHVHAAPTHDTCNLETFISLALPGVEVDSIRTAVLQYEELDYNRSSPTNFWPEILTDVGPFCQVNITYTHIGWNDTILTTVALPLTWNGRLLGIGGGGWAGGRVSEQPYASAKGWASVTTNAGHTDDSSRVEPSWGLTAPGNIDWYALVDFASVALDEAGTLGKSAVSAFYGQPPNYSYWNVSLPNPPDMTRRRLK